MRQRARFSSLVLLLASVVVGCWIGQDCWSKGAALAQNVEVVDQQVGGNDIGSEEYESFCAILRIDGARFHCGGVVVGQRFVLTARHCFDNDANAFPLFQVQVGYLCHAPGNCGRPTQLIPIFLKWDHPAGGDLTLLQLFRPISAMGGTRGGVVATPHLGSNWQPEAATLGPQTKLVLVSAGREGSAPGTKISSRVQKLQVQQISRSKCRQQLANANDFVREGTICSKSKVGNPCQGDSGSPIFLGTVVVAVHNWGPRNCQDPENFATPIGHFRVADAADLLLQIICNGPHGAEQDWCVGLVAGTASPTASPSLAPALGNDEFATTTPLQAEQSTYQFGQFVTIHYAVDKDLVLVKSDRIGIYPSTIGRNRKNEQVVDLVKRPVEGPGNLWQGSVVFDTVLPPNSYIALYYRDEWPNEILFRSPPFTVTNTNANLISLRPDKSNYALGERISVTFSVDATLFRRGTDEIAIYAGEIGPDPTTGLNRKFARTEAQEVKPVATLVGSSTWGGSMTFGKVLNPGTYRLVYYRKECCPVQDVARSETIVVENYNASTLSLVPEKPRFAFGERISVSFRIGKRMAFPKTDLIGLFRGDIGPDPATKVNSKDKMVALEIKKEVQEEEVEDTLVGTITFDTVLVPGTYRAVYYRGECCEVTDLGRSDTFVVENYNPERLSLVLSKPSFSFGEAISLSFSVEKSMAFPKTDMIGLFRGEIGPDPAKSLNPKFRVVYAEIPKQLSERNGTFVGTMTLVEVLPPGIYRAVYFREACCPVLDLGRSEEFTVQEYNPRSPHFGLPKLDFSLGEVVSLTISINKTMAILNKDKVGIFSDRLGPDPTANLNMARLVLGRDVKKLAVDNGGDEYTIPMTFTDVLRPGGYRLVYYRNECCPYQDIARSEVLTVQDGDAARASVTTDKLTYTIGEKVEVTFSLEKTMVVLPRDEIGLLVDRGASGNLGSRVDYRQIKKVAVESGNRYVGTVRLETKYVGAGSYRVVYYREWCCPIQDIVRSETIEVVPK